MSKTETAVLGGGCFWCVEAALLQLDGVLSVESGYMGGSAIFPLNGQRAIAEELIATLTREELFDAPIVTTIEPAGIFWKAEGYHQNYYANNPRQPYCIFAVAPKVAKVRARYSGRLKRP